MKRKLIILLTVLLAFTLSFTACFGGKEEEEEEKNNSIQSIEVDAKSVPTHVNLGETPDFSGIKVTVTYIDGTTKEVGFADVKISKVDTTTTGSKFVTVTYESSSVKFEIVVIDPEATATVTGIKIVPGSMPTSCFLAHTLDISKLQVEAMYDNGRANDALSVSEYTYTTIDTSTPGEKTFTVTYTANPALTDSITIKVLGIANMLVEGNSIGSKIFVGETLDTSNLKVVVYYEDGTSEIVTKADVTLGTIDSTTPGTKKSNISPTTMPEKNGERRMPPVAGSRKSPSSGIMVHAIKAMKMSVAHPAQRRPFFSISEMPSTVRASAAPLYLPKRGSTTFSVTHPPTIVTMMADTTMKK